MQRKDIKAIILYYRSIPEMKRLLLQEKADLESEYCGLNGVPTDSMPRGTMPGNPVENMAIALDESGAADRLREIECRAKELESDRQAIQCALDAVNGKYKMILLMRYVHEYSWGKISALLGAPDSTVRHWTDRAVLRLGKALEDAGENGELLRRASRARI